MPEKYAVEVPEDLDPAEVLSLVFTYMTAYQLLHRTAKAKSGETVLVHGAAGRVGTAVLELGAVAGLRVYGTASARDRAAVERLGAVAIDYRNEDFLARVRELTGDGVDIALDPFGGAVSLRSFRALRPGGRLVMYGRQNTIAHGRKNWPAVFEWYAGTATVGLWGLLSPRRRVLAYRVQKLRTPPPGLVPGGLRRAARAAPRGQDPPGRGRAPAAVRSASRARAAREHSGGGETRARAIADGGTLAVGRYLPIAEHGLIGDLHTVALVGTDGTIDWYCCPRFDSPSVFGAILDADRGGLFRISPDCEGWSSKQLYLPDTNVLITRFLMPDGVGEVQDFMPLRVTAWRRTGTA